MCTKINLLNITIVHSSKFKCVQTVSNECENIIMKVELQVVSP